MRPKVKYAVIYRHRNEYSVSLMCKFFEVSRSGYYDFVKRMKKPEKDTDLAEAIQTCQNATDKTYGYRRVWLWLRHKKIHRNPKTVLRVMKKYGLLSEIRRRRKWINMGQQIHKYENLLNRQFQADRPNSKWVTDISYIHTKEGVLYLSMIRDLYDNSIVAYNTAARQTVNLVLDTIRLAMKKEKIKTTSKLVVCSGPRRADYLLAPLRGTEGLLSHHYFQAATIKWLSFFAYLHLLPVNGSIYSLSVT